MLLLKLLLGVAGIGTGVAVPVVANKIAKFVPNKVAEVITNTSVWKGIQEKVAEYTKNTRVQQALKSLEGKECQLIKNPQGVNNGFDELYACKKGTDNKADFYYFGSEDSFIKDDSGSYLPKKVVMASYKEGQDGKVAQLVLAFDSEKEINWNIASGSGWKYFNNVILSDKCEIQSKALGGDDLRCELKDPEKGSTFYYSFSVF